jgi:hypothetical protein
VQWYDRQPARWASEQEIARRFLDDAVSGVGEGKHAFIRGWFRLLLNSGHELGRFDIRIVYPPRFPSGIGHPGVYLESHHSEWRTGLDSHIEATWRLCLFIPLESGLDFERPDALEQVFLILQTFLLRERFYQRDVKRYGAAAEWPGPQRAHGPDGLLQAMAESGRQFRSDDPCVCGSGRRYKRCCMLTIRSAERRRRGRQAARKGVYP